MRDAQGLVRLMDFGIAKQAGESAGPAMTALGMIVGTPEYMSPEQARGEKVDFRSDIYALGIVIFEIFTGDVPFRGETPIATIFKHLQDAPPIDQAALPPPLMPVLHKALAKSPGDRYPTAAAMVARAPGRARAGVSGRAHAAHARGPAARAAGGGGDASSLPTGWRRPRRSCARPWTSIPTARWRSAGSSRWRAPWPARPRPRRSDYLRSRSSDFSRSRALGATELSACSWISVRSVSRAASFLFQAT